MTKRKTLPKVLTPAQKDRNSKIERYNKLYSINKFHCLNQFKEKETMKGIKSLFFDIFTRKRLDLIYSTPSIKTEEGLFKFLQPAYISNTQNFEKELLWALLVCIEYRRELAEYIHLSRSLEKSLLLMDSDKVNSLLVSIENSFGQSIWLTQMKMLSSKTFGREDLLSNQLSQIANGKSIYKLVNLYNYDRIVGIKGTSNAEKEIRNIFGSYEWNDLLEYILIKTGVTNHHDNRSLTAALNLDICSSLIDLYESVVLSIQQINIKDWEQMSPELKKAFLELNSTTQDVKLHVISSIISPTHDVNYNLDREAAIESFYLCDYASSLSAIQKLNYEEDISLLIILFNCAYHLKLDLSFEHNTLMNEIYLNYKEILDFGEKSYQSAYAISILINRYKGTYWSNYLYYSIHSLLNSELENESSIISARQMTADLYLTPFCWLLSETPKFRSFVTGFVYVNKICDIVESGYTNFDSNFNESHPAATEALIRYYFLNGRPNDCIPLLSSKTTNKLDEIKQINNKIFALAQTEKYDFCCVETVNFSLKYNHVPSIIPIGFVISKIIGFARFDDLYSLILLEKYAREQDDVDTFAKLRYSFEIFLTNNDLLSVTDFVAKFKQIDSAILIYFLRYVWQVDVMSQTLLYASSKEIEMARIKVCKILIEMDPENTDVYSDEIKDRIKKQEILKGTTLLEKSKVFVDVDAVRRAVKSKLSDSYSRYKSISSNNIDGISNSIDGIEKHLISVIQATYNDIEEQERKSKNLEEWLSGVTVLYDNQEEKSEENVKFTEVYRDITDEFLIGEHGLNSYLSTRIRHGVLSGKLRKPLEDEKVLDVKGSSFVQTSHDTLFSDDPILLAQIKKTLNDFTSAFDNVLDTITNDCLQIKIEHKLNDVESSSLKKAWFIYRTSNLEISYAMQKDKTLSNLDDFIEYCIDTLWSKTISNLESVRGMLSGEVKNQLMDAFDGLLLQLEQPDLREDFRLRELKSGITRAKTETFNRLDEVVTWFNRSQVYDRDDYEIDFAIHIALNMIKNTISIADQWDGLTIKNALTKGKGDRLLIGRTLDGMVDIFVGLIENAIKRSEVEIQLLKMEISIDKIDGQYVVQCMNSIAPSLISEMNISRLASIKSSLLQKDFGVQAQKEGKSGLFKIWVTLNANVYKSKELDFSYNPLNSCFELIFRFSF